MIKRFFLTMILNELWHLKPIPDVAISFKVDRGLAQNLMGMAAVEASCLLKFCEEIHDLWAFRALFKELAQRLSNICTVELVPLMQLPCVKMVFFLEFFDLSIFLPFLWKFTEEIDNRSYKLLLYLKQSLCCAFNSEPSKATVYGRLSASRRRG